MAEKVQMWVAQIHGRKAAPQLFGCVQFYQEEGCVLIVARISGLPKESKQDFSDFTSIRAKTAPELTFPKQVVIITLQTCYIQNTQVTSHHYWNVGEMHVCP